MSIKIKIIKKPTKLRKIIDIPVDILPDLQELAKKDNRDLKNWIETILIQKATLNVKERIG